MGGLEEPTVYVEPGEPEGWAGYRKPLGQAGPGEPLGQRQIPAYPTFSLAMARA